MCRRSTRWLRRLDWLNRLDFIDQSRISDQELPVARDVALKALPVRSADGRVLLGFEAARYALARTPLGAPIAWAFCLPGLNALGRMGYAWRARRRRRDPESTQGACVLPHPTQY